MLCANTGAKGKLSGSILAIEQVCIDIIPLMRIDILSNARKTDGPAAIGLTGFAVAALFESVI